MNQFLKSLTSLVVVMLSLTLLGVKCSGLKFSSSFDDTFIEPLSTVTLDERAIIMVYYANTPAEQAQGLAGVEYLAAREGMLFSYVEEPAVPTFWMKGVEYPIDIIWISHNSIIGITKNVQPELATTPVNDYILYPAPGAVDWVVEVPAGFAFTNALQVGDIFTYSLPE